MYSTKITSRVSVRVRVVKIDLRNKEKYISSQWGQPSLSLFRLSLLTTPTVVGFFIMFFSMAVPMKDQPPGWPVFKWPSLRMAVQ